MREAPGAPPRHVALDSLRGVCALAVALFHYPIVSDVSEAAFVRNAYLFVDFFFVLSGFVIAKAYEGRLSTAADAASFLIKRLGRVWPLHLAMLGLFVAVSASKGEIGDYPRHSVAAIFSNIALIHSLGLHRELSWNTPSWSISVEAFLYVIFVPLVRIPARIWVYVAIVLASMAVLTWVAPSGMSSTYDYGVFRGLAGFFTGALVAKLRPRSVGSLAELGAVLGVVTFVSLGRAQELAPLIFGLAVMIFADGRGMVSRLAKAPPLLKLGEWSYSIYMVHTAVVGLAWALSDYLHLKRERGSSWLVESDPVLANVMALPYLAAVVAVSAVTYTLIEAPARAAFARWAARTRNRMIAASAS